MYANPSRRLPCASIAGVFAQEGEKLWFLVAVNDYDGDDDGKVN